jgi:signal transduction histidine kinase
MMEFFRSLFSSDGFMPHGFYGILGDSDEIRLTVRDSGRGFDPEPTAQRRGLGLTNMKERLKLAGGLLSIESRPGFGAAIHAHVPLSSPLKAAPTSG